MTERDWGKELAKIDKHLESVSDTELAPDKAARAGENAPPPVAARGVVAAAPRLGSSLGAFARLALSVLLGVGILFWPYQARCGAGLAAYLAAVLVVTASGVWSAVWTWRHRTARGHMLSLLLILWGLLLGSMEVLPRVGYAKGGPAHPTTWACP